MFEEVKPLVMIVGSDLSSLTWLDHLLSREGHRVTLCCSPAEALKAVAGLKLDLVIVGSGRPEHSGEALIRKIKTLSPQTNILLLMEAGDDPVFADAIASGAEGLLRRSYSESQVMQRVDQALHAHQT